MSAAGRFDFLCVRASTARGKTASRKKSKDNISLRLHRFLMFSIYRLCKHPEHIQYLFKEIKTMLKLPATDHYKHLPFMESFLYEVARHDPLESYTLL